MIIELKEYQEKERIVIIGREAIIDMSEHDLILTVK